MSFSLEQSLGLHANALVLRAKRSAVLASNLANVDTPGYKARDFEFSKLLASGDALKGLSLRRTQMGHRAAANTTKLAGLQYRYPWQASLDGNTVDPHLEKTAFTENALKYQASLRFLDGRIKSLVKALDGK